MRRYPPADLLVDSAHSRQFAPVAAHQPRADGNAADGGARCPAQRQRAGEYDRGLCDREQWQVQQHVLQPDHEDVMDEINAVGIVREILEYRPMPSGKRSEERSVGKAWWCEW